jgi:hypothetical protein
MGLDARQRERAGPQVALWLGGVGWLAGCAERQGLQTGVLRNCSPMVAVNQPPQRNPDGNTVRPGFRLMTGQIESARNAFRRAPDRSRGAPAGAGRPGPPGC